MKVSSAIKVVVNYLDTIGYDVDSISMISVSGKRDVMEFSVDCFKFSVDICKSFEVENFLLRVTSHENGLLSVCQVEDNFYVE